MTFLPAVLVMVFSFLLTYERKDLYLKILEETSGIKMDENDYYYLRISFSVETEIIFPSSYFPSLQFTYLYEDV